MSAAPDMLTAKGRATRLRIVAAAADLIYRHGVHGTSNDMVRAAAEVSGSQLSHYFPDKESLVRAVIMWRADAMMGTHSRRPPRLDSIAGLRRWARSSASSPGLLDGGCTFGSLASEVLKADLAVKDAVAAGFARWHAGFVEGLTSMRDRGELRADADTDRLAWGLAAAFQGGALLAQAQHSPAPFRAALQAAIDEVARSATPQA